MKSTSILIAFLFLISTGLPAQKLDIHALNQKLGKGINMGNMFEAPAEGEWGNPFRDDYFQKIAGLGFNHVRIPIRWDVASRAMQTAPFTIQASFLERIKYVIDLALSQGLYVIINMHHHDAVFQDPDGVKPRFLSQWSQIANYFKTYDQKLLFEVLNEPNTNLTGQKWNQYFKDALAEIRKTNPDRAVLMGIAPWGGLGGVPDLVVPEDENIIITVHYYDPFTFTHQGAEWVNNSDPWLGTKWENTTLERDEITGSFSYLIQFAKSINKPIHVGEFGAYSKADLDSRVLWTNFLARWFETQGFSWAYWEWSAGFGIFNPSTNQYLTRLADALLKDPMIPAKPQTTAKVFESSFGPGDGWNLYSQGGAAASLNRSNGQGIVDVTQSSGTGWHVQLVQNNIQLKKDSRYLVTVKASANVPVSITNYLGMNFSPWSSYSGYKSLSLATAETEQTYSFVMTSPTDPAARLVFDMGGKPAKITIYQVKVEEVLDLPVSYKQTVYTNIKVYPNPSAARIRVDGMDRSGELQIISPDGKLCKVLGLWDPAETIDVSDLIPGIYILRIISRKGIYSTSFVKN